MPLLPLSGFSIGVTADRRWQEQAELLERRGARVVHGPSIRTLPLGSSESVRDATAEVIADPPDIVVLSTGLGTRGWFAAADSHDLGHDLRAALEGAKVLARGPKSAGAALTEGLDVSWTAPTERSTELIGHLTPEELDGARVAVQLDGSEHSELVGAFGALGADVVEVPVYRWTLPDDIDPARRLVTAACEGRLDAITFTSAPAARNLAAIADDDGRAEALRLALSGPVAAVCVGPVCADAVERLGFTATVQPYRARLGPMVLALCAHLADRGHHFTTEGIEVVVQGSVAVVDGRPLELTDRERAVLAVLTERPGAVVSKAALLDRVWGPGEADEHAVEVTVARLRRRLGPAGHAVETAVRRGYRLAVDVPEVARPLASATDGGP